MKRASLIAMSFLLTLACHGDNGSTTGTTIVAPAPTLVGVSLSPIVQKVAPGQTTQLRATARYGDGSTKDVTSQATWTTSQSKVATVSAGAVTGVAMGRATVYAIFERLSASLNLVVEPDGTFVLTGNVTEPGGIQVGNATVEVISGPANQTLTNSGGFYELFGMTDNSIVRFGKTGYFDERRTVTSATDPQRLDVEITPRTAPTTVAGTYRMTITAPASCTILPADLRIRTYTARIDQNAARLVVTLSDAAFVSKKNTFSGTVYGDSVTFNMGAGGYYYYYYGAPIQELLPGGQTLGIYGTMTSSATAQSISGTLVGGFTLRANTNSRSCAASDTQVVFTRQ